MAPVGSGALFLTGLLDGLRRVVPAGVTTVELVARFGVQEDSIMVYKLLQAGGQDFFVPSSWTQADLVDHMMNNYQRQER